jgi:hypothetical protein
LLLVVAVDAELEAQEMVVVEEVPYCIIGMSQLHMALLIHFKLVQVDRPVFLEHLHF